MVYEKKRKRYLVSYIERSSSSSESGDFTVFSLGNYTDGQDFFSVFFYVYGTIAGLGVRCRCGQGLRFLVMMSAVVLSPVFLGSLVVLSGMGADTITLDRPDQFVMS